MTTIFRSLRMASVLGLALASATAASADEAQFERYIGIVGLFSGGLEGAELQDGTYLAVIAPRLRGTWAGVQTMFGPSQDAESLAQEVSGACERFPITINPVPPFDVVFRRLTPREDSLTITYSHIGGTTFSPHLDPLELAAYYGLDGPAMKSALMNSLRNIQQDLNIYVADDDIVIFATLGGLTQVFVRCPGDDRLGDPDIAIDDILLRSLEGDLPLMREAANGFLDCGRGILKTVPRADLADLANAVGGGSAAQTAFAETHPELVEQLAACVPADDS